MRFEWVNAQGDAPVPLAWLRRLARCAADRLRLPQRGWLAVAFVDDGTMRAVNRAFMGRAALTDVLSFRYDGEPIAGEILVAPGVAMRYAARHGVPYAEELGRYLLHGLLHWTGYEDRTVRQQRRMRHLEDRLLAACGTRPRRRGW